eukprot:6177468-Pleurochrysis_carterae.AAC.2
MIHRATVPRINSSCGARRSRAYLSYSKRARAIPASLSLLLLSVLCAHSLSLLQRRLVSCASNAFFFSLPLSGSDTLSLSPHLNVFLFAPAHFDHRSQSSPQRLLPPSPALPLSSTLLPFPSTETHRYTSPSSLPRSLYSVSRSTRLLPPPTPQRSSLLSPFPLVALVSQRCARGPLLLPSQDAGKVLALADLTHSVPRHIASRRNASSDLARDCVLHSHEPGSHDPARAAALARQPWHFNI